MARVRNNGRGLTDFDGDDIRTDIDPRPLDIKEIREKAFPKV